MSSTTTKKAAKKAPEKKRDIFQALADAQRIYPKTFTDAEGENLEEVYPYLTYPALVSALTPAFLEAGLTFYHQITYITDKADGAPAVPLMLEVKTVLRLIHTTGGTHTNFLESTWPIMLADKDPQDLGEWITYGKRYTLSALAGFAAEPDNDAATVSAPKEKKKKVYTEPSQPPKKADLATDSQKNFITKLMDACRMDSPTRADFLRGGTRGRADNIHDVSKNEAGAMISKLQAMAKEAAKQSEVDQTPPVYDGEESQDEITI